MANPFTGTGSTPQARAQSLGYSTGSAKTGGGKTAGGINTALANAIKQSQAKFPSAWAKATGTTDKTKQANQVTGKSGTTTESFTLSNKEEVDKKIKELRDYARTFGSGHYMPSILYQQANELEAKGYDSNAKTFTPEPKTKPPSIYGGQFIPTPTPTVPEGVQLTGISDGATVTFLNPTTASTVTQPTMPTGSGVSQTEYNILTEKYDKETADKLATQTYLTRGEVRAKFPQFDIEPTPTPTTPTPTTPTPTTPTPTTPTPTTPTPTFVITDPISPVSYLPFVLVGIVLIGIFLLRRRA